VQDRTLSFGYWLRRRRKALDLTQEALAQRVSCSVFSIRKIESDERRPSRRLAERLAATLAVPEAERRAFLDASRALRSVERMALDALPADDAAGVPAAAAIGAPGAADPGTPEATPFVGRRRELQLLLQLLGQLGQGAGGHTVLIEGEPGIGKTRLLREVVRHAQERGLPTLATKCYEVERAMPYQPVIELVSRALDRASAAAMDKLGVVSLAELKALVPEIGERFAELPTLSNDFPEARQARLSRAVGHLLEATLGGAPSLLIVDDLQWADEASAQVLHHLARHGAERAMLVVFAYRDEDVDNDERLARLVDSLCREAAAQRLPLHRLDAVDTAHLVAALADTGSSGGDLAERLHRETEGNPFFLVSMLQSLSEGEAQPGAAAQRRTGPLPDALRAAVRVRLANVPKAIRPVLETAAVLGRHFDFDTLLEVTGEPEQELLDAVELLVRRRLLREQPEGGVYDFGHDKVREVVYGDIGGVRRRLLHQAVAEALERQGEGRVQEHIARLADHCERAQVWTKALHYLLRAGEHSQALFAMRDALHWLDRAVALAEQHPQALDESQRLALYEQRGAARAQAGQTQGAVADMRRVVDAARAAGDRERMRDALVRLGMAYRRADAYHEATACLGEALDEARALRDEHQAADTLYHLGTVAWSTGQNDQAIRHHQQAVEICERRGFADLVAVQAYHGRGEAHFANAEPAAAIACYTRSLALARGIGDKSYESENLMMIGHACVGTRGLGDYARAVAHFDAALAIARAADLQWHLGPTLLGLDHVRACTGHYGEAWRGMQESLRQLQELGQVRYQFIALDAIAHLLLDLGQDAMALEHLLRGQALAQDTGIRFWSAAIEAHAAVARVRLGQAVDVAALQATLEHTRSHAERYMQVRCLDAMAEISLRQGEPARCRACADELQLIAEANGLRELQAVAGRWRGEALLAEAAFADAQAELAHAAMLAEATGRVRLMFDLQSAQARLFEAQGQSLAGLPHRERAQALAQAIEASLDGSGLQARLHS
jgi:tetratricopeptide (TPR) repeat protein/transcriptional regulator with XRE-family HTH domain